MGIIFNRRVGLGRGSGLNFSKSGVSYSKRYKWGSLGTRGFSLKSGIPGLSYRQRFKKGDAAGPLVAIVVFLTLGLLVIGIKLAISLVLVTIESLLVVASFVLIFLARTAGTVIEALLFLVSFAVDGGKLFFSDFGIFWKMVFDRKTGGKTSSQPSFAIPYQASLSFSKLAKRVAFLIAAVFTVVVVRSIPSMTSGAAEFIGRRQMEASIAEVTPQEALPPSPTLVSSKMNQLPSEHENPPIAPIATKPAPATGPKLREVKTFPVTATCSQRIAVTHADGILGIPRGSEISVTRRLQSGYQVAFKGITAVVPSEVVENFPTIGELSAQP